MPFDFDTPVDIRDAHASKSDYLGPVCGVTADDALAMWVADMDFRAAEAIIDAVRNEAERGFLGYYGRPDSWRDSQCEWLARRHGWRPESGWVTTLPGIMTGLALAMQKFSKPGDSVVLFSPVYHEFARTISANDRKVHEQRMIEDQGRYRMDLEGLARDMPANARIVVLCSPHNPGSRVWTGEELREVADFCIARDLILVSDEIHCDLVYSGNRHIPMAVAAPDVADRLITLVGATKAFNIAGVKIGAAIISNPTIKNAIESGLRASGAGSPNRFGMVATEAAFRQGGAWLDALVPYLEVNRDHFAQQIARVIPGARVMPMEATFLAWVDFSQTGLSHDEVLHRITTLARIAISPGPQFGPGGEDHIRFNIATHLARLDEALDRLDNAFSDLR